MPLSNMNGLQNHLDDPCAGSSLRLSSLSPGIMSLFPLFADLSGRTVLVLGGGVVAERKIALLLRNAARVVVHARTLSPRLQQWHSERRFDYRDGAFRESWLDRVWLVVVATPDRVFNRKVARLASRRRLFINVVDDAALSTFHVPAVVDRSPLIVAISSGGTAPMLARMVRERLESLLDGSWSALAQLCAALRRQICVRYPQLPARRRFYGHLLNGPVTTLLRQGRSEEAMSIAQTQLEADSPKQRGSVILVGAGPGDPGLLTLHALRALNEADVILHDRLVSREILDMARRDAECIDVGKQSERHRTTQKSIHALFLDYVMAGKKVIRLKGGDSFVFGRGGEELEFLRAHDIPYEVVPGITAAIGCAAYAGVPLTHRDYAQSVYFVTAHCRNSLDMLDWQAMARVRQTLAVYMGVAGLKILQARLLAHARAADTPFALIENGSRPQQRVITGKLGELAECARYHRLCSPALLVLGEVASLAPVLSWFGQVLRVEMDA